MRDRDVRYSLIEYLRDLHFGDVSTLIVEEMGVWSGTVRIDVAVINGELCGYEIKSDKDNLNRLPNQADIYSRVFDQVTLVVGSRHADKAASKIPNWWGIIVAECVQNSIKFLHERCATLNPSPEPYLIAELLRKDEAILVLDKFGFAKGLRSKKLRIVHETLATELPFSVLTAEVRACLKARVKSLG